MASKYIDNTTYATSGYTLSGAYVGLTIGPQGTIGGSGLDGGAAGTYRIVNSGRVSGTDQGIELSGGGIVNNLAGGVIVGSYGIRGLSTSGRKTNVLNSGTIVATGTSRVSSGIAAAAIDVSGSVSNAGMIIGSVVSTDLTNGMHGTITQGARVVILANNGVITGETAEYFSNGVSGGENAYAAVFANVITNAGKIEGVSGAAGIYLGSELINKGLVSGGTGVGTNSGGIINYGTIAGIGQGTAAIGIEFDGTSHIVNKAGATIEGARAAIYGSPNSSGYSSRAIVTNAGTIEGGDGIVEHVDYATVTNTGLIRATSTAGIGVEAVKIANGNTGIIEGYEAAYFFEGTNSGIIKSMATAGTNAVGVKLVGYQVNSVIKSGFTNEAGGLVEGLVGVLVRSGSVVNFGTIVSTAGTAGDAVVLAGNAVLVDEPGSRFIGKVVGGKQELDLAGTNGTLTGLGSQFVGFKSIVVAAADSWVLAGASTIAAGTDLIIKSGGTISDFGTILDNGQITINDTGTFVGQFSGIGVIDIAAGTTTLDTATVITGGNLELNGGTAVIAASTEDQGTFDISAGTLRFVAGDTFSVTGAIGFSGGTIAGSGFFSSYSTGSLGTRLTVTGGAAWRDYGSITLTGLLALGGAGGASGRLNISKGAVFDLTSDVARISIASGGSGLVLNAGLLEKTIGTGTSILGVRVQNSGTIRAGSGTLKVDGAIAGTGRDNIASSGTLDFEGAVAAGQTIHFGSSSGGELVLDDPSGDSLSFAGSVVGFGGKNMIDLETISFTSFSWQQQGSKGVLTVNQGPNIARITLFGQYAVSGFHAHGDTHGGTVFTYTAPPTQQVVLAGSHGG